MMLAMIMVKTDTCLTAEQLRDYLSGATDESQFLAIESHLEECSLCEQTLDSLEGESDTMVAHLRAGRANADKLAAEGDLVRSDSVLVQAFAKSRKLIENADDSGTSQRRGWIPPVSRIGPYDLLRPIGSGGMGTVFLARHRELGKQVAIKLLPSVATDQSQRSERFLREIRAAGSLQHPSIINATDAGTLDGVHYLVMEYIDGLDLSQIAAVAELSIADACEVVRQTALGLAHAHSTGIVHRDIKPSNLILRRDGEIKILDFGLAQVDTWDGAMAELTTVGQLMGTLDYMSPEQAEQPASVDYRADIYSLGATLFRLIAGRAPLAATPNLSPLAKLRLLANHRPPRLDSVKSGVPPGLVKLTEKMLSASPNDRPASASHVAESLSKFTEGHDLQSLASHASAQVDSHDFSSSHNQSKPTVTLGSTGSPPRRNRRWWAAALIPLFFLATVTIIVQFDRGDLVIESEVDDVSVRLMQNGEIADEIQIETGVNSTRVKAGSYQVVLQAGSDNVTINKGSLQIRRGKATVAHIRESKIKIDHSRTGNRFSIAQPSDFAIESASKVVLPKATGTLLPGQRLKLTSVADQDLEMELVVMADHTIKPKLIGVISVQGHNLEEVESLINHHYEEWYEEPGVELFLEIDRREFVRNDSGLSPPQVAEQHPAMGYTAKVPTSEVSAGQPVYDGQTLDQWLEILRTERLMERLEVALRAVEELATPNDQKRVLNVLIPNHKHLPKTKLASTIAKVVAEEAMPAFVKSQLEQGDVSWSGKVISISRMLTNDLKTHEVLANWLLREALRAGADPALIDLARNYILQVAIDSRHTPELRNRARASLREASLSQDPLISPFFIFDLWNWSEGGEWMPDLSYDLCKKTVLDKDAPPLEVSAAISVLRMQLQTKLGVAWKLRHDDELVNSLIERLRQTDRLAWSNAYPDTARDYFNHQLIRSFGTRDSEEKFLSQIEIAVGPGCKHMDPVIGVLLLAESMSIADKMTPELASLKKQTSAGYDRVKRLFSDGDVRSIELNFNTMTVGKIRWNGNTSERNSQKLDDLPDSQDWFDAYVHSRVDRLLRPKTNDVKQ